MKNGVKITHNMGFMGALFKLQVFYGFHGFYNIYGRSGFPVRQITTSYPDPAILLDGSYFSPSKIQQDFKTQLGFITVSNQPEILFLTLQGISLEGSVEYRIMYFSAATKLSLTVTTLEQGEKQCMQMLGNSYSQVVVPI